MTSSSSQDGPNGHHSAPQSQPHSQLQLQLQAQSQAESRPEPTEGQPASLKTPPASNKHPGQNPIHTIRLDDATNPTNQDSAPAKHLPASPDAPTPPVNASALVDHGILPRPTPKDDHTSTAADLVHAWLDETDVPSENNGLLLGTTELGPVSNVAGRSSGDVAAQPTGNVLSVPAQDVAPSDVGPCAPAATAEAVDSRAQNGLPSDFTSPDVTMLGQGIAHDFVQDLPAGLPTTGESYLPISSHHLPLSWSLPNSVPNPFAFQPSTFSPGASVSQPQNEPMSDDDDAASLDEPVLDETKIDRMARLEFADTFVVITTNTTIIGRDQRVYKRAVKNKKRCENGLPPVSKEGPQKRGHYSKSYVSQEGGALGPESDGEERSRSSKRRKIADNGQNTLSPQRQTPAGEEPSASDNVISSRQYVDHTPGAVPVDMENLRPPSDVVARIDIHGAGPDIIETSKGISRDHLKIQYDEENRVWQATAIGRNGFFCEEKLYHKDEVVTLRSGSHLQIQAVGFIFTISGVEDGKFGNEGPRAYYEGGKKMSLDFSDSRAEHDMQDTDEEDLSPAPIPTALDNDDSDDPDGKADGPSTAKPAGKDVTLNAESEEPIRPTIESDPVKEPVQSVEQDTSQVMVPPKKRGPGRPPKNGVMSKREERELKKKREEEDKRNNPPQEPGEPTPKRKVGRPRKHPRPDDEGEHPEKRRYKPRKPRNEDGEEEEDPEGDKADKQKRLQKPKTPPLDLGKKEDFTEAQLQKPNKNYQMLIDEVLRADPEGLTLKQIYKRIARKYPYFFFCVDTKGWESSVRHNLIGSHCFQKNQETHLWKRVEGIPLESGKKRKPSDTVTESRPPPVYNGNFNPAHGYQQPPHPQQYANQQVVSATGGPPMNGMPRYPPGGQGHPAPISNSAHPGTMPGQQAAARHGFPQPTPQQTPQQQTHQPPPLTTIPHSSTYTATAAPPPRPQYPSTQQQQHSYSSTFNQRPQQAPMVHGIATGSHPAQNQAQQPLVGRPGQVALPTSQRTPATIHTGPVQQSQRPPSLPHPQQPSTGPPAASVPAVEPSLREFLGKFSGEVVKQLQGRVKRPHAVAVSVINRGLGLTDMSLAPEHENFERAIINIFHTHKLTYSKPKATAASTVSTEHSKPPSAAPAPAVDGNSTVAANASAPAAPPAQATSVSAPNGSASNGPGTPASNVNGPPAAATTGPSGTTMGSNPGLGRDESSTNGPALTAPSAPSPTAPEPAHASKAAGAGSSSGSSAAVQPHSVPKVNNPAPSRSSATPAPGTPSPDANNVQLLDPKLVEVIQQYKRLSQQVLIPQLGQLQAEILVMSAVNRVLGFTTESIVPHTTQTAKKGLREAEEALIKSLKPRVDTYLRSKQAPSTITPAGPATSTPTTAHPSGAVPLAS